MTNQLMLKRNASSNRFCVPAALALLTGRHVDDCESLIREHLGDVSIEGVYYPVAFRILRDLGYKLTDLELGGFVRVLARTFADRGPLLVTVQAHILVLHNGLAYDNQYPEGIDPKDYRYGNASVQRIWAVSPPASIAK